MAHFRNAVVGSIVGRSLLFGLNLGILVHLTGLALDFWGQLTGTKVMLIMVVACVVLLPVYERIAQLKYVPQQGPQGSADPT